MIPTMANTLPNAGGAAAAPIAAFGGLDRRESAANGVIRDQAYMTAELTPLLASMGSVKGAELFPGETAHGMLTMGDKLLLFFGTRMAVCTWPTITNTDGSEDGDDGGDDDGTDSGGDAGGGGEDGESGEADASASVAGGSGSEDASVASGEAEGAGSGSSSSDSGGGDAGGSGSDGTGAEADGDGSEEDGPLSDTDKVLCAMGSRALIWPDKKMWTAAGGLVDLGASYTAAGITFSDGEYQEADAALNTVTTSGEPFPFRVGDGVTFGACGPTGGEEKTAIVREMSADGRVMRFYPYTFAENGTVVGDLTIERFVPDIDHVCASGNRVWGCKGDTIWACKLGDPTNWLVFDGTATDSWSAESGTPGEFTACATYLGQPTFFKEDQIFRLYGSRPTNFELNLSDDKIGVYPGAARTLTVAGGPLYFLSHAGIIRYNGGKPKKGDDELGDVIFSPGACGGGDGVRYWFSGREAGSGDRDDLLCYNANTGLWCRERPVRYHSIVCWQGAVIAQRDGGIDFLRDPERLGVVPGDGISFTETLVTGWAELAPFDYNAFGGKYPVRLWVRAKSVKGISVEVSCDGGNWEALGTVPAGNGGDAYLAFPVRRCSRFGLKFSGDGLWSVRELQIECRNETDARR